MTTSIKLAIEFSSLGETTEKEAAAFAKEVESRIEAEYPDASVSVTIDMRGFGGLEIYADIDLQDDITEQVNFIRRDVWENGNWHRAA
ncbi:TPA: hypothetical protein ACY0AA_000956 [Escherichia coli]